MRERRKSLARRGKLGEEDNEEEEEDGRGEVLMGSEKEDEFAGVSSREGTSFSAAK